jgi:hypothetical protein
MHRHATLYLYELAWMLPSVAIPVGMLAALAVTAFGVHIGLPGEVGPPAANAGDFTVTTLAQNFSFWPGRLIHV